MEIEYIKMNVWCLECVICRNYTDEHSAFTGSKISGLSSSASAWLYFLLEITKEDEKAKKD